MGNKVYPMRGKIYPIDTLWIPYPWVPGGEKWAAPPVKIAQILTYAPFLRSKKATFARKSGIGIIERPRNNMMDTPGTVYMNLKMGENAANVGSRPIITEKREI